MPPVDTRFATLNITRDFQRDAHWFVTPVFSFAASPQGVVASWNIAVQKSETASVIIYQRVGNETVWGPWREKFHWSRLGARSVPRDDKESSRSIESPTRWQFRFQLPENALLSSVGVTHVPVLEKGHCDIQPSGAWGTELSVPPLSQLAEDNNMVEYPYSRDGRVGNLICSPTCLAMVYAYHGVSVGVRDVARAVYDPTTHLYGVWALNTASASLFIGAEAYVVYAGSLAEIEQEVLAGRPVVASIAWDEGQLTNASQSRSAGHLVVVAGFTTDGDVVVCDPNTHDLADVRRVLNRSEFFTAWTRRSRACYVIVP